jgi:hypothetical protein
MFNSHPRVADTLSRNGHAVIPAHQLALLDTPTPATSVDESLVEEIGKRLEQLESYLRGIESEIEAQSHIIGDLETGRTALRVRVAALESQLLGTFGAVCASVVQHVAVVVVLACGLAALAAFALRGFGVGSPLTEPIVISAFVVGALSGAFAMAIHFLR